jgi:hypothetical protein
MPNAAAVFATHVAATNRTDIPAYVIQKAGFFILDKPGAGRESTGRSISAPWPLPR